MLDILISSLSFNLNIFSHVKRYDICIMYTVLLSKYCILPFARAEKNITCHLYFSKNCNPRKCLTPTRGNEIILKLDKTIPGYSITPFQI